MAEGDVHKHLKLIGLHFLKQKCRHLIANEVKFYNSKSIADVVGINLKRKEVRVIECKSSYSDFKRDKKLFDEKTSYYNHANYSYIMCPANVIPKNEMPHGYGLLYVDEYDNVTTVKNPTKNEKPKTRFETTLRRTSLSLTNELLYKSENIENKDKTSGAFKRNANIFFISVRCPQCKRATKELIHKESTKILKCKYCKKDIDLNKAKTREITGYNDKFIKKILRLSELSK